VPALPTIAVDAMGGDFAPAPEIEGAVAAAKEGLARVILVGDRPRLEALVEKAGGRAFVSSGALQLVHASQVITMEDHPGQAARSKKDSSMRVAFDLAKSGQAQAVLSAGNSGAVLALGLFVLKRLPGVDRPGVVTTFPTKSGVCALIDMGANVDVRPQTLAQFAVLGATYARILHRKSRPRVGLLSNGEEATKGTELTRGAHKLLSSAHAGLTPDYEYVGYIEGKDIFTGQVDVVVTDGFTGNVVLKTAEGAGQVIFEILKREVLATPLGKLGALLLRDAFKRLKRAVDYDEYGGAPLVGVDGLPILAHGRSNGKAIKNAIRVAASLVDNGLVEAVAAAIDKHAVVWRDTAEEPGVPGATPPSKDSAAG
jgi:glycerol-3-phosphate acyltransferase PlsX